MMRCRSYRPRPIRTVIRAVWATALAVLLPTSAIAQTYPARPVKIVSPWPPGGVAEVVARLIADRLAPALGKPVVVESVPGANGTIGTTAVARAAPDGHTLLMSHAGPMTMSPHLQPGLPYDPLASFAPVTQTVSAQMAFVIRGDLPVRNVREFIDYARARPGQLNLGSIGQGSSTHLAGELMKILTGIEFVHVPYKGSAPVVTDMLAGRVDFSFINFGSVLQYVEQGKIRGIGRTGAHPSVVHGQLPAIAETLPGFDVATWSGIEAPAGTPRDIVNRLNAEITRILRSPDMVARLNQMTYDVAPDTPEQHAATIRRDLERWGKVIRSTGIKFE